MSRPLGVDGMMSGRPLLGVEGMMSGRPLLGVEGMMSGRTLLGVEDDEWQDIFRSMW